MSASFATARDKRNTTWGTTGRALLGVALVSLLLSLLVVPNASAAPGDAITGTVTDQDGAPAPGVEVCAYYEDSEVPGAWNEDNPVCPFTDEAGSYTLVPEHEAVRLGFRGGEYLAEYYEDAVDVVSATTVVVPDGGIDGIDAVLQHVPVVEGHVTGSIGEPLANIQVCASWTGFVPMVGCRNTDAEGNYSVSLPSYSMIRQFIGNDPYEFTVRFIDPSGTYASEYYDDSVSSAAAQILSSDGEDVTGIDASLREGSDTVGRVAGVVTNEAAAPLADAQVCIHVYEDRGFFGSSWQETDCTQTAPDGTYALDAGAETVRVSFEGNGVKEFYDNVYGVETAQDVPVPVHGQVNDINAQLEPYPTISGNVTSPEAEPVADIEVCALSMVGGQQDCATSAADGSWQLQPRSGQVFVSFKDEQQRYRSQFYPSGNTPSGPLPLTPGTPLTVDTSLIPRAVVTGTATDSEGAAIGGVSVCEHSYDTGWWGQTCATTEVNGAYSLPVQGDEVRVYFQREGFFSRFNGGHSLLEDAPAISTPPGETVTGVDITLPDAGAVTGVVRDELGVAVPDMSVCAVEALPDGGSSESRCDVTDDEGGYTVLPATEDIALHFSDHNVYLDEYYDDTADLESATRVLVPSEGTSGIDATVSRRGVVEGAVTSQTLEEPLAEVQVCSYVDLYSLGWWVPDRCAWTGADGAYSLGVGRQEFRIGFQPQGGESYQPEFYNNVGSVEQAQTLSVAPGEQLTGIDASLSGPGSVAATILGVGDAPVGGARLLAYQDGELVARATTAIDGRVSLELGSGDYQFRVRARHYADRYPGGDSLATASTFSVVSGTEQPLGEISLVEGGDWSLGQVAGERLSYCDQHVLPANDDESTNEIALPFQMQFFGDVHEALFVNNNGNVTFGQPWSGYTPESISGDTSLPIIAPFHSDADTTGDDSWQTTYGTSPDGKTFCVLWGDVGYYSQQDDRLNGFQLLLHDRSDEPGRSEGDFDIVFNYDRIQWESGDATDGTDGLGGTTAVAGYSAGQGLPGTFTMLDGSLEPGAFLDGGPKALIEGSANSAQPGRYVFPILNADQALRGSAFGQVTLGDGSPVEDAGVQACLADSFRCFSTYSREDGSFDLPALPEGLYALSVSPPAGSSRLFPGSGTFEVAAGEATDAGTTVLRTPQPPPAEVAIDSLYETDGIPVLSYSAATELSITGQCEGAAGTYSVVGDSGQLLAQGDLSETAPGTYAATIAGFPAGGSATVTLNVDCEEPVEVSFAVYIDPSGTVTDQYGNPLSGATVTLSRSDVSTGPFVTVPDGSDIMDPANRANPDTTGTDGSFGWDVTAGWYIVTAELDGCDSDSTEPLQVPPPRLGLELTLTCDGAALVPLDPPALSSQEPHEGAVISVTEGTWPEGVSVTGYQWLRDGAAIPGAIASTYVPAAGDVGSDLSVVVAAHRDGYEEVAFTVAAAEPVTGEPTPSPTPTPTTSSPTPVPTTPPAPAPVPTQPVPAPSPSDTVGAQPWPTTAPVVPAPRPPVTSAPPTDAPVSLSRTGVSGWPKKVKTKKRSTKLSLAITPGEGRSVLLEKQVCKRKGKKKRLKCTWVSAKSVSVSAARSGIFSVKLKGSKKSVVKYRLSAPETSSGTAYTSSVLSYKWKKKR